MAYYSHDRRDWLSRPLLLLLGVALLAGMWVPSFFGIPHPVRLASDFQGFLYARLHAVWDPISLWSELLAMLLVVACAFLLFFYNHRLRFIREDTLLPLFFMFLLSGMSAGGHYLSPGIYGMVFMTVALIRFLDFERFSVWTPYDVMFLLSLGSLFTFHLVWYVPVFLMGMLMIKQLNLRNLSATFMGLTTPYLLTGGYMYLSGRFDLFWTYLSNVFQSVGFYPDNDHSRWYGIGLLAFVGLVALVFFYRQYNNDKIQARLSITFIYLLWVVSFVLRYLYPQPVAQMSPVSCLFMSILFAHYFALSKSRFSHILFFVFVLGSVGYYLTTYLF